MQDCLKVFGICHALQLCQHTAGQGFQIFLVGHQILLHFMQLMDQTFPAAGIVKADQVLFFSRKHSHCYTSMFDLQSQIEAG